MGWPRRLGFALALILLGGSAVLAGQALEQASRGGPPPGSGAPSMAVLPAAPVVLPPEDELVATAGTDLEVSLPGGLTPRSDYRLRIYVNDQLVRERGVPRESPAKVRDIPLQRGENRITAAIAGPAGESLHSPPLLIARDDVAPTIHITAPSADSELFTRQVTIRGRTEAGAVLTIRNGTNGESHELEIGDDGRFEQRLALGMGPNSISLRSRDPAGNRSRASLRLVRVESRASLTLEARPETIKLAELPRSLSLIAGVRGQKGEELDGATVTFSISVPGQATFTHQVTSHNGTAVWRGLRLPREGALAGQGLATAMVLLNEGQPEELVLQESASIRFR